MLCCTQQEVWQTNLRIRELVIVLCTQDYLEHTHYMPGVQVARRTALMTALRSVNTNKACMKGTVCTNLLAWNIICKRFCDTCMEHKKRKKQIKALSHL